MLRPLAIAALAAVISAGEAPPPPIVRVAVADGSVLAAHWDASLWGRVWSDPGLAWFRQQWSDSKGLIKTGQGLDLDALLAGARGLRGEFLGLGEGAQPMPRVRLQAGLGAQAQALFALAAKSARPDAIAVPGAAEARLLARGGPQLARHGETLVLGWNCEPVPWPVAPCQSDLSLVMDYGRLLRAVSAALPPAEREAMERSLASMRDLLGELNWDVRLVPEGLHEVMVYDKSSPGILAVDRALLDRFPATAIAVLGVGFDLGGLWQVAGQSWLDAMDAAMHGGRRVGVERTRQEIDAALAGLGVAGGIDRLLAGCKGTFACAVTPGSPFPGVTLAVPRSAELDALVAAVLAQAQAQVPAVGASTLLPIPDLPILVSIGRDAGHWLLGSDAMLMEAWLAGRPGGFLASPAGKAVVAAAPAGAYALGSLDTAAAFRLLTPLASMGLAQARGMPAQAKQGILTALARLARDSTPSILWSAEVKGALRTEARGPLGMGVAPIAIIAAIAIPNLLESRVTANEAAARAALKSGIFPAQVQFQGGGYMDQDQDNVGEYGTLAELGGRVQVKGLEMKLLAGPLTQGDTAFGYRFRIDLPDGAGGAVPDVAGARLARPHAADLQERFWIAYAWPESVDTGRRMFAIWSDGQVRSLPWDGQEPKWGDALGGKWEGEPVWPLHDHFRQGRQGRQAPPPVDAPVGGPAPAF